MWIKFDKGDFRRFNYNKVVARGCRMERSNDMRPEPMTKATAYRMFQVAQDVNWINEPQIAIRRSNDRSRKGFI